MTDLPPVPRRDAADRTSYESTRAWIARQRLLPTRRPDAARKPGPLLSRDIPDTSVVPWASTGWTNNRNVTQMLEFLDLRGEVAIAGRAGGSGCWDLPERVYPAGVAVPLDEDAERASNERRLALARHRPAEGQGDAEEPIHVGTPASRSWSRASRASGASTRRARPAVRGTHGAAVAVRPARPRPRPRRGAVRLRVRPRDVQAQGRAPLGLLRPSGPAPRPAGRQARRHRRPQGRRAAR